MPGERPEGRRFTRFQPNIWLIFLRIIFKEPHKATCKYYQIEEYIFIWVDGIASCIEGHHLVCKGILANIFR